MGQREESEGEGLVESEDSPFEPELRGAATGISIP